MRNRRVLFINLNRFATFAKNVALILLFLLAFLFIILSRNNSQIVGKTDSIVLKYMFPTVHVLTLPAKGAYLVYENIGDITDVYTENQRLKQENRDLMLQQNKYYALRAENKLLSKLLKYEIPDNADFVTAQIISSDNKDFSYSVVVYLGDKHNVSRGQISLNEKGVVGRVDEVGGNYARIMLITDINSKIPVMTERQRVRGILSGDNTSEPKLIFTPLNADIRAGDLIVTSGVAGGFPSGLPIGTVYSTDDSQIKVKTLADIEKLEYVKIVDYGIKLKPAE